MPLSDSKVIGRLRVAQERAFGVGRGPSTGFPGTALIGGCASPATAASAQNASGSW